MACFNKNKLIPKWCWRTRSINKCLFEQEQKKKVRALWDRYTWSCTEIYLSTQHVPFRNLYTPSDPYSVHSIKATNSIKKSLLPCLIQNLSDHGGLVTTSELLDLWNGECSLDEWCQSLLQRKLVTALLEKNSIPTSILPGCPVLTLIYPPHSVLDRHER